MVKLLFFTINNQISLINNVNTFRILSDALFFIELGRNGKGWPGQKLLKTVHSLLLLLFYCKKVIVEALNMCGGSASNRVLKGETSVKKKHKKREHLQCTPFFYFW